MDKLAALNAFVATNQAVVVLVGVPILTVLVTMIFSLISHRSLMGSESKKRDLDRQIQIASFRFDSLKELRSDYAEFVTSLRSWRMNNIPPHELVTDCYHKVLFQLTPKGTDYESFVRLSENLLKAPNFPEFYSQHEELKRLGSKLFHGEKIGIENSLQAERAEN